MERSYHGLFCIMLSTATQRKKCNFLSASHYALKNAKLTCRGRKMYFLENAKHYRIGSTSFPGSWFVIGSPFGLDALKSLVEAFRHKHSINSRRVQQKSIHGRCRFHPWDFWRRDKNTNELVVEMLIFAYKNLDVDNNIAIRYIGRHNVIVYRNITSAAQ